MGAAVCGKSQEAKNQEAEQLKKQRSRTFKEFEPRCVAEVSLEDFKFNIAQLQRNVGKADDSHSANSLMINLANNAFGHGALECAKVAVSLDVKAFCVSTLKEAISLREGGITPNLAQIVVMGEPMQMELAGYSAFALCIIVASRRTAEYLCEWGDHYEGKRRLLAYVLVDTGSTGIGVPAKDAVKCVSQLSRASKTVKFMGLCTNTIDERVDAEFPRVDLQAFAKVITDLSAKGIRVPYIHFEKNQSILYEWEKLVQGNLDSPRTDSVNKIDLSETTIFARCGTQAYGFADTDTDIQLRQCLTLKGQVRDIRLVDRGQWIGLGEGWQAPIQSLVAVISCGFVDGYPRFLNNKQNEVANDVRVRINNDSYKIKGEICSDHMLVHLGSVKQMPFGNTQVKIGDYAVLYGSQTEHKDNITLLDLARAANVSPTKLICSINPRVSYHYKSTSLTRRNTLTKISSFSNSNKDKREKRKQKSKRKNVRS